MSGAITSSTNRPPGKLAGPPPSPQLKRRLRLGLNSEPEIPAQAQQGVQVGVQVPVEPAASPALLARWWDQAARQVKTIGCGAY